MAILKISITNMIRGALTGLPPIFSPHTCLPLLLLSPALTETPHQPSPTSTLSVDTVRKLWLRATHHLSKVTVELVRSEAGRQFLPSTSVGPSWPFCSKQAVDFRHRPFKSLNHSLTGYVASGKLLTVSISFFYKMDSTVGRLNNRH